MKAIGLSLFTLLRKHVLFFVPLGFFLWFKFSNLGILFSDTNVYFYIGKLILEGNMLYRDIFFTNLPLFALISAGYYWILQGNLLAFYVSGIIEILVLYTIIYVLVYRHHKKRDIAVMAGGVYLFSTHVMLASGQQGITTASLFAVLAYISLLHKRYVLSGILLACMILTKAYFVPVACAFVLFVLLQKKYRSVVNLVVAGCITSMVMLLPFAVSGFDQMKFMLFDYSLSKSGVFNKTNIFGTYMYFEFLILFATGTSLVMMRKYQLFGFISLFFWTYFGVTHTIYASYILVIIPFMALFLADLMVYIRHRTQLLTLPTLFILYALLVVFITRPYSDLDRIHQIDEIVATIQSIHPSYIYGTSFITTALSVQSGVPLLDNLADTDETLFVDNILDNTELTMKAIETGSVIVVWGVAYSNGTYAVGSVSVDQELLASSCKQSGVYQFNGGKGINALLLYDCSRTAHVASKTE